MMVYCLTTSRAFRGLSIDGYPNLKAYLAADRRAPGLPAGDGQGRAGHGADAGLSGSSLLGDGIWCVTPNPTVMAGRSSRPSIHAAGGGGCA